MIAVEKLAIRQGAFSLEGISFEIPAGDHVVLMGKTGTGKTSIIEAICGLRPIQQGKIVLDGKDVTTRKPAERGIGFVPQDGALFGSMSVYEQLAFSLSLRKWSRRAIQDRVEELALLLNINPLLDRKPANLSGGEKQRVALGRALAFHPAILCLDEPLSALDEETRGEMYSLLKHVQQVVGVTSLHVTHNPREATILADSVLLLRGGKITQLSKEEFAASLSNESVPPQLDPTSVL